MVERSTSALDYTYMALAHPTRRAMLELLKTGSMRVTDLAGPFEVSLAASSKHVNMLERAGLLSRTVAGRDHWLRLDPRPMLDAGGWIDTYRGFWEERLDDLDLLLRGDR
jgi:DNA-binding transcriptional ArsR family regulator